MKIIRNEKLIKRNAKIGQFTSIGSLLVLVGAMYISMTRPELSVVSLIGLIVGFIMTQMGMYYGNRWGRRPRPDEQLDAALKGLPGDSILYHYSSPVPHLFVTSAGVWVLLPFHQKGKVTFQNNRWKNSGGGFLQSYLRIFGQESIGRPEIEASHQISILEKFFKKKLEDEQELPPINAALVFLDPNIEIESEGSPYPAMQAKKLKELFRKTAKEQPVSQMDLMRVKSTLEGD